MSDAAKKSKKSSPAVLVTRIAIFGGLGILLALAFIDYRMKSDAEATSAAIRKAVQDKGETEDLLKSEVRDLIKGSPLVLPGDVKALKLPIVQSAESYRWKGVFRTYVVTVGYSLGNDPAVEIVEGPGPSVEVD
jgi:hypothetical protein